MNGTRVVWTAGTRATVLAQRLRCRVGVVSTDGHGDVGATAIQDCAG